MPTAKHKASKPRIPTADPFQKTPVHLLSQELRDTMPKKEAKNDKAKEKKV